ncbi:MAG: flavin reductase [Armatimonadetes bacterium CG_4_10_14_3_um_filter_66_18]|nr:flavin reductase [Armatimonadota bacterium]OIO91941.1 MAG: hypothetical protein AUJ96_33155 [Armatimonadetes bacterium CG2_30_66_41]PIU90090.1 MAG: flavin reductase [Armatimonadetes bacterium CG06_land_8_20_14_3_00_66_21]PIX48211.1 MAG: flavin reductase [Armatimonadetes bacterium CG_4_8_14_3_um_filter_66_20]PIY52230.1 MAG: flavin reductase [Armatimonadetes bacterium CG_4_10_14_3_um_filter_66_18]PIZ35450.1 MAG: flavin reductase [Armatimonadetes bacterium CG_4_10_14_0_8_um_filter_66_14]PJB73
MSAATADVSRSALVNGPAVHPERLAEALGLLPVGLHVVTAFAEGKPAGLLCGWVTQASWTPPLIAIAVGRGKHTHQAISDSGAYAVNLLREEQTDIARVFGAKSGRDANKFAGLDWRQGRTGSPLLEGTAGYLDCRVTQRHEIGDHSLFVGEIVQAASFAQQCLVYQREVHQSLFVE